MTTIPWSSNRSSNEKTRAEKHEAQLQRRNAAGATNKKKKHVERPIRCGSPTCLLSYILGFVVCLFYTTFQASMQLHHSSSSLQLRELRSGGIITPFVASMAGTNTKYVPTPPDEAKFPQHCLPWPGQDPTVEGGYLGFHLLLKINDEVQKLVANEEYDDDDDKATTTANTSSRMLCVWDLPLDLAFMDMKEEIAAHLATQCQSIWIIIHDNAHSVEAITTIRDLTTVSPLKIHVWLSTKEDVDSHNFLTTLQQHAKQEMIDWVVMIPNNVYVVFELLQEQLKPLSAQRPIAVAGGVLAEPNKGKPKAREAEPICPGWVFSRPAIQSLSSLSSSLSKNHGDLHQSLLEALRQRYATCATTSEYVPFTIVNISNYTENKHWRRLNAVLHGTCDDYWNKPLGAFDENGKPGYIHDPTFLRHHHTLHSLNTSLTHCTTEGKWFADTRKALAKIEISPPHPRPKRVLCMVYTHSNRHEQLRAIAETWGPRCDGFMAASNLTDRSLGAVNLWHEGPEEYENMWLKVRSMWEYAHEHYIDEFDFFHIGGDDHYVIPENLQWTVSTGSVKGPWDHSKPLYLGGSLAIAPRKRYCGGGSGYTLNRVLLKKLMDEIWTDLSCNPHWKGPDEDMAMSRCIRQFHNLQCMDTNDDLEETRYHPWDAAYHSNWDHTKKANWYPKLLRDYQKIESKDGMGQISKNSVSFHLKPPFPNPVLPEDYGMRLYYAHLYGKC